MLEWTYLKSQFFYLIKNVSTGFDKHTEGYIHGIELFTEYMIIVLDVVILGISQTCLAADR